MSDTWSLTTAKNGLLVQDNPWGALQHNLSNWDLTISVEGEGLAQASFSFPEFDPAKVLAFPEMLYGPKFGNTPNSGDSPLPLQLTDCDLEVAFDWGMHTSSTAQRHVYNVAIETFFHSDKNITGPGHPSGQSNKVFELMVWLKRPDAEMNVGDKVGEFPHAGYTFDVIRKGDRQDYVAFIAQSTIPAGVISWKAFVDETMKYFPHFDPSKLWMGALEFGPEIWAGRGTFTWKQFDIFKREHNTPTEPEAPPEAPGIAMGGCLTADTAHELARYYHQASVAFNGIARYYEAARDKLNK